MASSRPKKTQETAQKKKKYSLHPRHKPDFSKLVKHLHILGVDVRQHLKSLDIEKAELEKLEKEESSFISAADAEQLDMFLHDILGASEALVKLEGTLFRNSRPLVNLAHGKVSPSIVSSIGKIFGKQESGTLLKEVHDIVLASFYYEKNLFDEYPLLMEKIERAVKNLQELEKKWGGNGGQLRLDMLRMHKIIRKIIHEDVYDLSNEIFDLYGLRMQAYKHLIALDKKNKPREFPNLEQEYYQTAVIQGNYIQKFREHSQNLTKIYGGGE